MTTEEDLCGAWHLTRWVYTVDGTFRGDAMGEDARGQIIYSPDGHMSAILSRNDRAMLPAATWPQATPDERFKATAYVLGRQLRADAIRVSIFRQVMENGQWVDAPVSKTTTGEIESKVLARARDSVTLFIQ